MFPGLMSRTRANTFPVSANKTPPMGPHNGNLTSLLKTSTALPPRGLKTFMVFPFPSFITFPLESRLGTSICGPASSKPNPLRSRAPPPKNRSEIGNEFLPPKGLASPSRADTENTVSRNRGIG